MHVFGASSAVRFRDIFRNRVRVKDRVRSGSRLGFELVRVRRSKRQCLTLVDAPDVFYPCTTKLRIKLKNIQQ